MFTFSVISQLDPTNGVGATDPVVVSHHQLQGHPLDTQHPFSTHARVCVTHAGERSYACFHTGHIAFIN